MLSVKNLVVAYGNTPLLANVSFDLIKRKTLALVGETGSGKTTIINTIMRNLPQARQ
ncbi:MAG: ATP-binding cassette domain-containing protein [Thermoprotei archaeon]